MKRKQKLTKGRKIIVNVVESNKGNRKSKDYPALKHDEEIASDVLGSYTGVPADKYEKPVQDADDL